MTSTIDPAQIEAVRRGAHAALARQHLLDYCSLMDPRWMPARHLALIADHLERLERREIRKLAITMPPRHGKTRLVSQLFASWYLGRHPDHDIILASYGSELAEGNSRAVRTLVQDERFPFSGLKLREDSRAVNRWETNAGATLIAASLSSGVTGRGYSLAIGDDLVKDRAAADSDAVRHSTKEWYSDAFITRAAPDAIQVMIGTRWHDSDILSDVIDSEGWTVLNLPLISEGDGDALLRPEGQWLWPERFKTSDIPSVEKGEITARSFAALYQQRPVPAAGFIFLPEWFKDAYEKLPQGVTTVQSVDSAWKTGLHNDRSVIATLATDWKTIFVDDLWFGRAAYSDLQSIVIENYHKHRPSVLYVEEASSGYALVDSLRRSTGIPIKGIPPGRDSKEARVEAVSGFFQAGRVKFRKDAAWMGELLNEFLRFPAGKHDDIVDAVVLGVSRLREEITNREAWARFKGRNGNALRNWFAR